MATAELDIKVDASDIPNAKRQLADLEKQGANTESRMDMLGKSAKLMGLAFAAAGIASVVRDFARLADATNTLEARVSRLAGTTADSAYVWQSLTEASNQVGASIADTVTLWSSLDQSISATDAEIVTLTSTLQKLGKIGGASSEEMSNSLRQLGQSFAGGIVRAEEFNSVLEGTPEIWRRVASAQGISLGELRAKMLEGKLTADMVFDSLMSQTEAVNADFERMPRTVEMASNALSNNFAVAVAELDRQLGASEGLTKFIDMLSVATNSFTTFIDSIGDTQDTVNGAKMKLAELYEEAGKFRDLSQKYRTEGSGIFGPDALDIKRADEYDKKLAEVNQQIAKTTARLTELQSAKSGQVAGSGESSAASGPAYTPKDTAAEKEAARLAKKLERERENEAKILEAKRQAADQWLYDTEAYQMTEQQMVDRWYQEQLAKLEEYKNLRPEMASEANNALIALEEERERKLAEIEENITRKKEEQVRLRETAEKQATTQMAQMQWGLASQSLDAISMAAEEGSALQKTAFLAGKGMAAAQAIMQAELASISTLAAYAAAAAAAGAGGPALLAAGQVQAANMKMMGYASAGVIMAQGFAGAFDNGGNIPSGQWGIVGERGPEIVQGPANVTSRKKTAALAASAASGGDGGAVYNFNISQTISGSGDEALAKVVDQATKNAVNEVQRDFAQNGRLRKTLGA